jgi:hypothetical protein
MENSRRGGGNGWGWGMEESNNNTPSAVDSFISLQLLDLGLFALPEMGYLN